jgi:hypothetical protein
VGEESWSYKLEEGGGSWRLKVHLGMRVRQLGMQVRHGVHVLAACAEETGGEGSKAAEGLQVWVLNGAAVAGVVPGGASP